MVCTHPVPVHRKGAPENRSGELNTLASDKPVVVVPVGSNFVVDALGPVGDSHTCKGSVPDFAAEHSVDR